MLKRVVNWILVKTKLRKPKGDKDPLQALVDIVPYIVAAGLIIAAVGELGSFPGSPWYRRLLLKAKHHLRLARLKLIGY